MGRWSGWDIGWMRDGGGIWVVMLLGFRWAGGQVGILDE